MIENPTKIAFAGDWHANTRWGARMVKYAAKHGAEAIVHVGDFGFHFTNEYMNTLNEEALERNIQIYFVDGNHEDFNKLYEFKLNDEGVRQMHTNITHLPRGYRWTWNGTKFMAMGGAFSIDRLHRVEGYTWWPQETITDADMGNAIAGGLADVVISHDCPSHATIPGLTKGPGSGWPESMIRGSENNREVLQIIVDHVRPHTLIHGHYHQRYDSIMSEPNYATHIIGLHCDGTEPRDNMIFWYYDKGSWIQTRA